MVIAKRISETIQFNIHVVNEEDVHYPENVEERYNEELDDPLMLSCYIFTTNSGKEFEVNEIVLDLETANDPQFKTHYKPGELFLKINSEGLEHYEEEMDVTVDDLIDVKTIVFSLTDIDNKTIKQKFRIVNFNMVLDGKVYDLTDKASINYKDE